MKLIIEKAGEIKELELGEGEYLVGRAPDCQIKVDDPYLSRHHFRLIVQGGKVKVEDVKSRSGIYVGKRQVKEAELKGGDILTAGKTRFSIVSEDVEETLVIEEHPEETLVTTERVEKRTPEKKTKPRAQEKLGAHVKMIEVTPLVRFWKVAGLLGACLLALSLLSFPSEKGAPASGKKTLSPEKVRKEASEELEEKVPLNARAGEEKPYSGKMESADMVEPLTPPPSPHKPAPKEEKEESGKVSKVEKKAPLRRKEHVKHASVKNARGKERDTKRELAYFNFQSLLKRADELKGRGEPEDAVKVLSRACSMARKYLSGRDVERCEVKRKEAILACAKKVYAEKKVERAYALLYQAGFNEGDEFFARVENDLREKVKDIYARSALDVQEARRALLNMLKEVPEGSPIYIKVKNVLERLR